MIISYQWLLSYLPEPLPIEDLSDILTSIGLEVEAVEPAETIKGSLEGLVIGEVMSCIAHPNADKLKLTTVNTGTGSLLQIVCGAPNVAAGQKVIVAPVGTTVHPLDGEAFLIKKAKIRGEESQGMICAEDEIGLGKSQDGIIILPDDAVVGTLAKDYYHIPVADTAIHIGLTPNRSDAMSHIGVVRDVCAWLSYHRNKEYRPVLPEINLPLPSAQPEISVTIDAPEACLRYAGLAVNNVKVGPSPEWLQQRLNTIGIRSINNLVDITNFVLHEYGQPLHAFDADKIGGKQIHVGFLPEGTEFVTLDDKTRKLRATDLMICDADKGMCIAGVFGGAGSGITDSTRNLFLESAYFHPSWIRRTSLHHGLRTDAATHFEKGIDINNLVPALKRAAALIVEIAGGTLASGITDIYPKPLEQTRVTTSYNYIRKLSGKVYSAEGIDRILTALGFTIEQHSGDQFTVLVPANKTDVTQPADIVEEILRIDGLDNIEIPDRLNISLVKPLPNDRATRKKFAEQLCGGGFQEIVTNSIVNSKYYPERSDLVRMLNSLSSELDVMRPSMLESGLEVIAYNCNRKSTDLALFEYGKVYNQQGSKYIEEDQLGLWLTGNTRIIHWNQKSVPSDIYYLKGVIKDLLLRAGIHNTMLYYENNNFEWKWKNQALVSAQTVDGNQLKEFDIRQPVYFAAIHWQVWMKAMSGNKIKYQEVPKFPAVNRDLAIVLDKAITYSEVQQVTEQLKLQALQEFSLFDVFESEKLGSDKKSYAMNYTFQMQDRTLTDTEIEQLMQQLVVTYKTKLRALIRE